jgi:hypothetical protein
MTATFTWIATATGQTIDWETLSACSPSVTATNFTDGVSQFLIPTHPPDSFNTISFPTGEPAAVGSLDAEAGTTLIFGASQEQFQFLTLNNGAVFLEPGANSETMLIGFPGTAGTLSISSETVAGGASGGNPYVINGAASTTAALTGTGPIIAFPNEWLDFGNAITIAADSGISLNILVGATLELDDTVNSGVIQFIDGTGLLALDGTQVATGDGVSTLTNGTFPAPISGLVSGLGFTDGLFIADANHDNFGSLTGSLTAVTSTSATLVLTDQASDTYSFNLSGDYLGDAVQIQPDTFFAGGGGSDVFLVTCFVAGTRIATPDGESPVESLSAGDLVRTVFAGTAPVTWLGRRHVDCRRHKMPDLVWPVRVRAGAFGEGKPSRDLWLSPNHAVFVNDVLIPIKYLINGASIEQIPTDVVTYYHIELPAHDVLFAEGMPAESWLDIGDRSNFDSGGGHIRLFPDFSVRAPIVGQVWETVGCAPLIVAGPRLKAVRAGLHSASNMQEAVSATAAMAGREIDEAGRLRLSSNGTKTGGITRRA